MTQQQPRTSPKPERDDAAKSGKKTSPGKVDNRTEAERPDDGMTRDRSSTPARQGQTRPRN